MIDRCPNCGGSVSQKGKTPRWRHCFRCRPQGLNKGSKNGQAARRGQGSGDQAQQRDRRRTRPTLWRGAVYNQSRSPSGDMAAHLSAVPSIAMQPQLDLVWRALVALTPSMSNAPKDVPVETEPPKGWGADDLTKFLDNARYNQWASFAHKQEAVKKLVEIDAMFVRAQEGLDNPESEIAAFLLLRCLSAFRTAAGLAMAGQAAETYAVCRAMLEYAAYAAHIYRNSELGEVWLRRHEDEDSYEAQRAAFSHRKVLASVVAANRDAGRRFEQLYNRAIDFGAHANERAVTANMAMVEQSDRRYMHAVMQHGDSAALDLALKTVAQSGLNSLEMLQIVFNARFELLGINARMLELHQKGNL